MSEYADNKEKAIKAWERIQDSIFSYTDWTEVKTTDLCLVLNQLQAAEERVDQLVEALNISLSREDRKYNVYT